MNRPSRKTLTITGGALAFLVVLAKFILPLFQPTDVYREALVQSVESATGSKLEIRGGTYASVFPPRIVFEAVGIKNDGQAVSDNIISADKLIVHLPVAALFSSTPRINNITLVAPRIALESFPMRRNNWDKLLSIPFEGRVTIADGQVSYDNHETKESHQLSPFNVVIDVSQDRSTSGEGSGTWQGIPFEFTMARSAQALDLSVQSGGNEFKYTGIKLPSTEFQGPFSFATGDMQAWVKVITTLKLMPERLATTLLPPKPLAITGTLTVGDKSLVIGNASVNSEVLAGKMDLSILYRAAKEVNAVLHLTSINLHDFLPAPAKDAADVLFPKDMSIKFALDAEQAKFNNYVIGKLTANAEIAQGDVVLNQVSGTWPGGARLVSSGLVRENENGLVFDGNVDGKGENFYVFLSSFMPDLPLPQDELKAFALRAGLYVSKKEVRSPELSLALQNTQLSGALIMNLDEKKINTALRISGINLDKYLETFKPWAKAHEEVNVESPAKAWFKPYWSWMLGLKYGLKANIEVNPFTLNTIPNNVAKFSLMAENGVFNLQNISAWYEGKPILGEMLVDLNKPSPEVKAKLALGYANTNLLGGPIKQPDAGAAPADVRWSQTPLSFPVLELINGEFNLRVRYLQHMATVVENALIKATLQDTILNITSFTGEVWGGKSSMEIKFSGGKLPAIASSFNFANISADPIFQDLAGIPNIKGVLSLTGSLSAGGLSLDSWIKSLKGNMRVAAYDIAVTGFELSAMVRAVSEVRSVADIINVSRLALGNGATLFDVVEGIVNFDNGVITTGGFSLISEMAQGQLLTTVSLPQWNMNTSVEFTMDSLSDKNTPTVSLQLSGPISDPKKVLDTKRLEEYVAERTARERIEELPAY